MVRMKKKVYVLMVSRVFPKTHPKSGQETYFKEKILRNCVGFIHPHISFDPFELNLINFPDPKLHTIRGSYNLWKKRADKINAGEAILSLRQWSGQPYKSKQVEFMQLEKIGVERAKVYHFDIKKTALCEAHRRVATLIAGKIIDLGWVAKNDGLSERDFIDWFKKDLDGVVIHFTQNFRYGK
jgi:hypothetical protein